MDDVTSRALRTIHQRLRIDEEWTDRSDASFSWTGLRLEQHFAVSPPVRSHGLDVHRLSCTVPVVREVRADEGKVLSTLGSANNYAAGEALVWDPGRRCIFGFTGSAIHEETVEWRSTALADFAIVALCSFERIADGLAELVEGAVVEWHHPLRGRRDEADDMLNVVDAVFCRRGGEPSFFARESEFERVYQRLQDSPYYSAGASADGICIEVPFGSGDTALIEMRADVPHPLLGNGLLTTLSIPAPEHVTVTSARLAAALNRREATGRWLGINFGAWCVHGTHEMLAHVRFTPNNMFMEGLAADIATTTVNRALMAAEFLLDQDRPPRAAHKIVWGRFGDTD
jgi:hypothetical protein